MIITDINFEIPFPSCGKLNAVASCVALASQVEMKFTSVIFPFTSENLFAISLKGFIGSFIPFSGNEVIGLFFPSIILNGFSVPKKSFKNCLLSSPSFVSSFASNEALEARIRNCEWLGFNPKRLRTSLSKYATSVPCVPLYKCNSSMIK